MSELLEAKLKVFKLVGYDPTPEQLPIHADESRIKEIAGGERAGKSVVDEKELLGHWWVDVAAPLGRGESRNPALYWLIGANYAACRGEWNYAVEDFSKLEIIASASKNIDPGEILLKDGTRIVTKSGKYVETIATEAPDGIVLCEPGQAEYEVLLRCLGRLAEKRGWMVMGGTFEEEQYTSWFREYFEMGQSANEIELKSFSLPTWTNIVKFPGGRKDPEILRQEASMTPERFMERFGGVPCPKTGRVMLEFSNSVHVKTVPFNPNLPVYLAVDPGYGGAHVVLFIQEYEQYIAVFDEIYVQDKVTEEVILIAEQKDCWGIKGQNIAGGAIDIEAKAHHGMPAPISVWQKHGIFLATKKVFVEDGINLVRTHLKVNPVTHQPKVIVDPKCRGLISECGGCKPPIQEGGIWMRDKHTGKPRRENDHACKALIYFLANKYGFVGGRDIIDEPLRFQKRTRKKTFARR